MAKENKPLKIGDFLTSKVRKGLFLKVTGVHGEDVRVQVLDPDTFKPMVPYKNKPFTMSFDFIKKEYNVT